MKDIIIFFHESYNIKAREILTFSVSFYYIATKQNVFIQVEGISKQGVRDSEDENLY